MVVREVLTNEQAFLIENAWENRDDFDCNSQDANKLKAIGALLLAKLDSGTLRIAEKVAGEWKVDQLAKKAVLLSFKLNKNEMIETGMISESGPSFWYDKVPSKFSGWEEANFSEPNIRAVPGSFVRHGSYIGKNVVLMPCFVNIGAYIDDGTMIDTWAAVGSCAQIGKNCHISGGTGIAGVLEPVQANPTIIEDNCFIGARSEIAEGVIVGEGAVIGMGVFIGASTKIIDRETGEIFIGKVPPYSVVVPGTIAGKIMKDGNQGPSLSAAIIVKKVDDKTRSKTSANELLRSAV